MVRARRVLISGLMAAGDVPLAGDVERGCCPIQIRLRRLWREDQCFPKEVKMPVVHEVRMHRMGYECR